MEQRSLQELLGISPEVVSEICARRLEAWAQRFPVLGGADAHRFLDWYEESWAGTKNEVLHALSWWAWKEGGDDTQAASVLAWLMKPAACAVIRGLGKRLESGVRWADSQCATERVAASLFICCRTIGGELEEDSWAASTIKNRLLKDVLVQAGDYTVMGKYSERLEDLSGFDDSEVDALGTQVQTQNVTDIDLDDLLDGAVGSGIVEAEEQLLLSHAVQIAASTDSRSKAGPAPWGEHNISRLTDLLGRQSGKRPGLRSTQLRVKRAIGKLSSAAAAGHLVSLV
jgi:hypothetical protein